MAGLGRSSFILKSGRSTVIADGNRDGNDGSHQRPEAAAVNSHLLSRI
jgi:hypothetical protein